LGTSTVVSSEKGKNGAVSVLGEKKVLTQLWGGKCTERGKRQRTSASRETFAELRGGKKGKKLRPEFSERGGKENLVTRTKKTARKGKAF